jgi:beta-phosphoglucomutase-like phosphatase (HAD superfamily)
VGALQALLFDVDGTLADTERDGHRVAFNAAFAEAGLDWNWSVELYRELLAVTGGKERIRYFLDTRRPALPPAEDVDAFIAGLHRAKTRIYTEALAAGGIPLRSGVLRLLQEARAAGLHLAVATTTTPDNVTALLYNSIGPDAPGWFEVIAAGDVVPAKKPAPDIYTWALSRLGLPASAAVAFEDSAHGLRSARDAGIATVLVTVNDYTRGQDFAGASLVLDGLGEPDAPFRVLAGDAGGAGHVDLALLRRLHAAATE